MTVLTAMKDKKIVVLGLGLTGLSCVRFLHQHGLSFAVNDSRTTPFASEKNYKTFRRDFIEHNPTSTVSLHLGQWSEQLISEADIIIASPGIDLCETGIKALVKPTCSVIGDVELFCQLNNELPTPIKLLAVTGSNGKSTVVSLLAYLGRELGFATEFGGNIGQPVLDLLPTASQNSNNSITPEYMVLELSSFQLETVKSMRAIAATVLNISDDHLDRHQSFSNYQAIKQGIYTQTNVAVFNRDDSATFIPNIEKLAHKTCSFGTDSPSVGQFGIGTVSCKGTNKSSELCLMFGEQALIPLAKLPLAGLHNAMNYLAALALGHFAGWSVTTMVEKLTGFKGLAHRCQRIDSSDNIQWINDSKATNVGATLAAIEGLAPSLKLTGKKLIVIAGGEGKGADFSPLEALFSAHVSQLITFGKDGSKLASLMTNAIEVENLAAAVSSAKNVARDGDMVLLSPACASIDMFTSFVARGNQFIELVAELQTCGVNHVNN